MDEPATVELSQNPTLTRRKLLALVGSTGLGLSAEDWTAEALEPHVPMLTISEPGNYLMQPDAVIRERFARYAGAGVKSLRVAIGWRHQTENGELRVPHQRWLDIAVETGFKLKVEFGSLSGPPAWFLQKNAAARLVNARGEFSWNDLNLFWTGLEALLNEKNRLLTSYWKAHGLFDHTNSVIADLGPAGEPIYPPAWTMGPGHGEIDGNFWFFGSGAAESFQAYTFNKYQMLPRANKKWGTDFLNWPDVKTFARVPSSSLTSDLLEWYRDKKRSVLEFQIRDMQQLLSPYILKDGAGLVILVPGSHILAGESMAASDYGDLPYKLTLMPDTDFLVGLAHRLRLNLQYTGLPNDRELSYLNDLNREDGKTPSFAPLVFGENRGDELAEEQFLNLADEVRKYHLAGLDYVSAEVLFGKSGDQPSSAWIAFCNFIKNL